MRSSNFDDFRRNRDSADHDNSLRRGKYYEREWDRNKSRDRYDERSHDRYRRRDSRPRSRSRSYSPDKYGRSRRRDRKYSRRSDSREVKRDRSRSPQLSIEERDRRTIFVNQLAARLRTRELKEFFEQAGPVRVAEIVKDRISGRSKGVGYVEFVNEEDVIKGIALTGKKLLGIPIIAQYTETEKNRQAAVAAAAGSNNGINRRPNNDSNNNVYTFNNNANINLDEQNYNNFKMNYQEYKSNENNDNFHRIYAGNIHFNISEEDIAQIFEPFGELEFVKLQKDPAGRSKGYAFIQFKKSEAAKTALEKMNGFEIANRPLRVGVGNEKLSMDGAAQSFQGKLQKAADEESEQILKSPKPSKDANIPNDIEKRRLDDPDSGVSFQHMFRDSLMKKLLRDEDQVQLSDKNNNTNEDSLRALNKESLNESVTKEKINELSQNQIENSAKQSRCIILKNMFDKNTETGENWIKELEDDVRIECEEKYGKVIDIRIETDSDLGSIYVKFLDLSICEKAKQGLNGRFFGGRKVSVSFISEEIYNEKFGL